MTGTFFLSLTVSQCLLARARKLHRSEFKSYLPCLPAHARASAYARESIPYIFQGPISKQPSVLSLILVCNAKGFYA